MSKTNVSRTVQSYLQVLVEQMRHYAVLRLFDGIETAVGGRLCLDAQVPALLLSDRVECACTLIIQVTYRKGGQYEQNLIRFDSHYDPGEVLALGPARWGQLADTLAYQLIGQLVQWKKERQMVSFTRLPATTSLLPDRQRFYL